jgi:hypothetical protein
VDVLLKKTSASVKLPSNCNRRDALSKGARRLSDDSQLTILDEINQRDILDYKEDDMSLPDDDSVELSGEWRGERSHRTTPPMMEVSPNNNSVICKNTCFGNSAPQMLASDVQIDLIVLRMCMRFW